MPDAIDYINLHGTATPSNDRSESHAVTACSDRDALQLDQGATGHTLGAAGALEAVICALALQNRGPASEGFPRVIALADQAEIDSRGPDTRLDVGDSEDDDVCPRCWSVAPTR